MILSGSHNRWPGSEQWGCLFYQALVFIASRGVARKGEHENKQDRLFSRNVPEIALCRNHGHSPQSTSMTGFNVRLRPNRSTSQSDSVCRRSSIKHYLNVFRIYSAIFFASASGIVFSSNLVMPGPGFLIFFTMSSAVLTPLAASSF